MFHRVTSAWSYMRWESTNCLWDSWKRRWRSTSSSTAPSLSRWQWATTWWPEHRAAWATSAQLSTTRKRLTPFISSRWVIWLHLRHSFVMCFHILHQIKNALKSTDFLGLKISIYLNSVTSLIKYEKKICI